MLEETSSIDGVLVVDKPAGWTSHDVVNKIRRIAGTKKVGHLGTLDPMATGVLPLVVGRATRLAQFYTRAAKSYEGTIRFGWATDTYDAEGEPVGERREPMFTLVQLEEWVARFRGRFEQTPPPVSAKKIGGTPAYKLARKNIAVEIPAVEVEVTRFDIVEFAPPAVRFEIDCGAGTYVRSIAHDLGALAGCGAHLAGLRRTRSGDFTIAQARTIEEIEKHVGGALVPTGEMLLELPAVRVDDLTASQVRQGRDFRSSPFQPVTGKLARAIARDGSLVAVGELRLPGVYHPIVVL
ncbi:MAG: tRNA pseudouridine(55) synthase TruB [Bryobacteraceae bacterium]|nr:tRNA pseudouridine(55) synthase TruB [Bryobacteraceae bacterium]